MWQKDAFLDDFFNSALNTAGSEPMLQYGVVTQCYIVTVVYV